MSRCGAGRRDAASSVAPISTSIWALPASLPRASHHPPRDGRSSRSELSRPGRALRRRDGHHRRYLRRRLGSGGAAAPERESLALLPSGPDAVRTLPVRGTRSVNASFADPIPTTPSLGRRSAPHGADFGFREPLTPHLARPGRRRVPPRRREARYSTSVRVARPWFSAASSSVRSAATNHVSSSATASAEARWTASYARSACSSARSPARETTAWSTSIGSTPSQRSSS